MSRHRLLLRRLALPSLALIVILLWAQPWSAGVTRYVDGLTFAAGTLDRALSSAQPLAGTRIVSEARAADGAPCRAFVRAELSGIACRRQGGWHLRVQRGGVDLNDPAGVAAIDRALRRALDAIAQH